MRLPLRGIRARASVYFKMYSFFTSGGINGESGSISTWDSGSGRTSGSISTSGSRSILGQYVPRFTLAGFPRCGCRGDLHVYQSPHIELLRGTQWLASTTGRVLVALEEVRNGVVANVKWRMVIVFAVFGFITTKPLFINFRNLLFQSCVDGPRVGKMGKKEFCKNV